LRREGNKAVHQYKTRHKDAMNGLKVARSLAVWYHQSFGKQEYSAEYKERTNKMVIGSDKSTAQIAKDLGLKSSTLHS